MTSTSAIGIDPGLKVVFDWVPALLTKDPRGTRSQGSRKPSFYDKHLADNVVLKHVKLLPSLTNDITGMIDKILHTIQQDHVTLPPFGQVMPPVNVENAAMTLKTAMNNENSISEFYSRSTAMFCPQAASLLALYPDLKNWKTVLLWTVSPVNRAHAIANGSLQLLLDKLRPGTLDDEMMKLLHSVLKMFPDLAVWEFKSLAGNDQVMLGIKALANTDIPFSWTTCKDPNSGYQATNHDTILPTVGPDGDDTPWTLPSPSSSEDENVASQEEGVKKKVKQIISTIRKKTKRKHDDDDPSYRSAAEITSQYFIQQVCTFQYLLSVYIDNERFISPAWAEAVRVDATLIIINAGNFEYIGVRHRASQTLFLSNILKPHELTDPGYGKLHIGIYVAALKDAINRFQKLSSEDPNEEDGKGNKKGNQPDRSRGQGIGRERGSQKGRRGGESSGNQSGSGMAGNKAVQSQFAFELFSKPKRLLMYLQFSFYNSPVPATFVRTKSILPTAHNQQMTLVLDSELGEGATGKVHGGSLEMETPDGCVFLDVVAKLAFSEDQQEGLNHEYSIYCHLASKAVKNIPAVLGLFDDVEKCALALILTPAGVPITSKDQLSAAVQLEFLSTLQEIHNAGILHGDIRRENLLMNDAGGIAIIDFDQSRKNTSAKAMMLETSELNSLLDVNNNL